MAKLSSKEKVFKYLDVQKNHFYAKYDIIIRIDEADFKVEDEELVDISEDDTESLVGSINIPGILNVEVPEENDEVQLYFPFDINFVVSDNVEKEGTVSTYYFTKGDLIAFAMTKSSATDIMILDKLFENRIKYLSGDLPKHIIAIYDQLLNTANIRMQHIETILTVLYGEYTDDGFEPTRLTKNQKYSKANALNSKDSAHKFNAGVGFNYGYTKDVIVDNITRTYTTEKTDLEKVISGDFEELK